MDSLIKNKRKPTQPHFRSVNDYLYEEYGKKIYKLALNGGMSCPNRDGTIGTGGCTFCSPQGSGDYASSHLLSITEQIEEAKQKIRNKTNADSYIAYFQSYTNTYASVEYLEKIFMEAVAHKDIEILSIATRPDCLQEPVIELLDKINRIKPVWIELGLQSIHEKTEKAIRRGFELSCFDEAVERLKRCKIMVIVHVILGLPGEDSHDMTDTIDYIGKSGADGIKLQLLHVIDKTDLAKEYENNRFHVLSLDEYVTILAKCIQHLPGRMIVHRITGDGPRKLLIAPKWSLDKKKVLNTINRYMHENDIRQGSFAKPE